MAALLVSFSTTVVASAQSGRADPGSPGGTEYDIPLEEARRDATGGANGAGRTRRPGGTGSAAPGSRGGAGVGPSGTGSPIFGSGISANGSGPGGDERGRGFSDSDGGTRGGRGRSGELGKGGRARPGEPVPLDSIPPLTRGEGSGVESWWPSLLAAAVLAAGGGFGVLMARMRARGGTTS